MMAPRFDPEFIFAGIPVTFETECFFCDNPITQTLDDWAIHITIPSRTVCYTHVACFEQLAWSMTNFIFSTNGKIEPEGVQN